ncbi:MAG: hypothetical protein OXH00_26160 [Candidatus Poribacteria bacterium]|nr:hypothetical protein [Candidatus Poribacteria bacterium]
MSAKPTELGYHKKDIGRCKYCREVILWGYMFGKKHPYDVSFDEAGTPQKNGSHMDTCPKWKSRGLKAQADAHTAAICQWQKSCKVPKEHPPIDYKTVELFDVPERHANPIALKLVQRGGPFESWHPDDLIPHFRTIAVRDMKVVAVLLTPAIYNRIHEHLHGFAMSVFSDMAERKPVSVAGYRLEPSCVQN